MRRLLLAVVLAMVAVGLGAAPSAAQATLVVDDDGYATATDCDDPSTAPYTTIGAAVTDAVNGDTVLVCPGTYAEDVNVTEDLTVTGVGGPVVNATVNGFAISGAGADYATVEGFEINQSTAGGAISVYGADHVTVQNNRVNGAGPFTSWLVPSPWAGMSVILSDHATVQGNYIHDTTGAGIWFGSSADGAIEDNHVVNTQYTGILLVPWSGNPASHDNVISGNKVNSAGNTGWVWDDGIRLGAGAYNNAVEYNQVSGSTLSGIRAVWSTFGNTIQNNKMRGNGGPTGAGFDAYDQSTVSPYNTWAGNKCGTSSPAGLC